MTEKVFRRIALGFDGASESEHMGHPDFRAHGRIFATLLGDGKHGMVALTPDQQRRFMDEYPDGFAPASGAWGRSGSTIVTLASTDENTLGEAMTLAWQNAATKAAARKTRRRRSS